MFLVFTTSDLTFLLWISIPLVPYVHLSLCQAILVYEIIYQSKVVEMGGKEKPEPAKIEKVESLCGMSYIFVVNITRFLN